MKYKQDFFQYLRNEYGIFWQMFKFGIVGVVNTLIDFSIYIGLTRFFKFWQTNYLWANVVTMIVAATSSFFCNKHWTFQDKNGGVKKQYLKFILVSSGGLLINELILFVLVEQFGFYDLAAKAIGVAVVFFWNFFVNRYWTFQPYNTKYIAHNKK